MSTPSHPSTVRSVRFTEIVIFSTAHDVADARLHRLCGALAEAGLSVELNGLGDARGGPTGVIARTRRRGGKLRRLGRALALPWRERDHRGVLVVVDPELALPGLVWRRLTGAVLVVDVHEDYRALLADRPWASGLVGAAAALVARTSAWGAAHADLTVVADDHVPPHHARSRLVVRNVPRPTDLPPPAEPAPTPRALYVGDVRRSRGLDAMVEAVLAVPPWELDIVGPVGGPAAAWVRQRTTAAGARIRLHGRLPLTQAWRLAGGAWIGMLLLEPTPAFRAALPSKLYEYLGCGLAVLASPLPRVRTLLESSGAGLLADGPQQAAACLRRWSDDPGLLAQQRTAARGWAREHLHDLDEFAGFAQTVHSLSTERSCRVTSCNT